MLQAEVGSEVKRAVARAECVGEREEASWGCWAAAPSALGRPYDDRRRFRRLERLFGSVPSEGFKIKRDGRFLRSYRPVTLGDICDVANAYPIHAATPCPTPTRGTGHMPAHMWYW